MIFTGFKRKSNQLFFNKRLPNLLENLPNKTSEKIKKVLVILDDISEINNVKKNLSSTLKISEKDIDLVIFQKKTTKNQELEGLFSPKDIGWYGKIKSEELKNILTKKYDLLINYNKVDNLYANIVLLHSKAVFKAGFSHLDNRLYDLLIKCKPDEITLFNNELKKYLTILNKIK